MKFRNVYLALKEQGPFKRFIKNFFITRNAWGLFHRNSHIAAGSGKPKVSYPKKESAQKAAASMQAKHGSYFSVYKCMRCDGYHIGKNRKS